MKKILIKNGTVVNYDRIFEADILVSDGKIEKIEKNISVNAETVIDARGKYVFPGGIDPHVHFHLPFYAGYTADDFYTGSRAALKGGTTTVIDFVTPKRGQSLIEAYEQRLKEAENALCNVKFHVSPVDWHQGIEKEMEILVKNFGVKSFKIYLAYKHAIGIDDNIIIKVLETAKKIGALITAHCEHDETINYLRDKFVSEGKTSPEYHAKSRPPQAEAEAIERFLLMAKAVDTEVYIVHVSTEAGIKKIIEAKNKGQKVYAETCPQYLLLTDDLYEDEFYKAAKYVMSPPLRKKSDNQALWQAIKDNYTDTVGTDHCSFNLYGQKDLGKDDFRKIPNGAPGVEHRLQLLYTYGVLENRISLQKFVEITSYNPAKIFGLEHKGYLAPGFDADIIIWNKEKTEIISAEKQLQNVDNTIYEGWKVIGKPETVILNGQIVNYN